jgi:hypothetical protein
MAVFDTLKRYDVCGHQVTHSRVEEINKCPYCNSQFERTVDFAFLVLREGQEPEIHARCFRHRKIVTWADADEVIKIPRDEIAMLQVMTA